jgi:benzoyl-CoA reductase subunit A
MKYCVGIDLGSTTTKAVILGESGGVLGRGITNSRSNYEVACEVALAEALINARFTLIGEGLEEEGIRGEERRELLKRLELRFREQQYRAQLENFAGIVRPLAGGAEVGPVPLMDGQPRASLNVLEASEKPPGALAQVVDGILKRMDEEAGDLFSEGATRRSDFFRDLAGSRYMALAEAAARDAGVSFDRLAGLFDKAILQQENTAFGEERFEEHASTAAEIVTRSSGTRDGNGALQAVVAAAARVPMENARTVGTGYGRSTLPFPKEQIRSEILCHGLGAHDMFPGTRTVLDIGGQDTKAIQVDGNGLVTSFQMNDRCAAGCGRYLGYIADEMNVGVHELGPMACQSSRPVRINSTCTVFAGAELRERLSLGEKREDILAGLHRAIILRAMSLLARSGGISNEFTFTGGVAKNRAAVDALRELSFENYGELTMNISPDSIYTGALGAALFARREWRMRDAAGTAQGGMIS